MLKNRILPILMVAIMSIMLIVPMRVSAVSVFFLEDSSTLTTAETEALDAIDSSGPLFETFTTSEGTGYYFNKKFFDGLPKKQQRQCAKALVKALDENPLNPGDRQVIYSHLKEVDNKYIVAEIGTLLNDSGNSMSNAITFLKPFTGIFGTILGVLAIVLSLALVLCTVIDLFCIGVPVFTAKTNGEKPKFMSNDAYKALRDSQENDENPYLSYFKRRALTYVLLIMCIIYLVSGGLGDLFMNLVDVFSGITELFGGN